MALRTSLFAVFALALMAALWLTFSGRTAPAPGGPPAETRRSDAVGERETAPVEAPFVRPERYPAPDDEIDRAELPTGTGRLRVQIHLGAPISMPGPLVLAATPVGGGEPVELVRAEGSDIAVAELAARRHKLTVARGPGDHAGCRESAFWVVDPPDDVVDLASGTTTNWPVRVVPRVDAPERGTARLVGTALLDGAPARDLVVRVDQASGAQAAHVGADGRFAFDEIPAGLMRVELCSRMLRQGRDIAPILVYAAHEIAPSPGGIANVEFDAWTAVLEGSVRGAGTAPGAVIVELTGDGIQRANPFGAERQDLAVLQCQVDPTGRFRQAGLPPGSYAAVADADGFAAPPRRFEIPRGVPAVRLELALQPYVSAAGTVAVDMLPTGRARPDWLSVRFRGPVVREARVRAGEFRTDRLIPGRYEVVFLGRGAGFRAAEPVEIGETGAAGLHLVPVRR